MSEIQRYSYVDGDGNYQEFGQKECYEIVYEVCEDMSSRNFVTAIILIESIAEKIYESFSEIKPIQRRVKKRRQGMSRRHDD